MAEREDMAAGGFLAPARAVEPGWIDYNGHMNVAYYSLAFDEALDLFFDAALGIGPAFVAAAGMGPYALQAQYHYLAELRLGDRFRIRCRLLDCDAKRVHVFSEMFDARTGGLAATHEQVTVNVDHRTRRSAPYPEAAQARLRAVRAAHAALPRPDRAGAPIGFRRRPGSEVTE